MHCLQSGGRGDSLSLMGLMMTLKTRKLPGFLILLCAGLGTGAGMAQTPASVPPGATSSTTLVEPPAPLLPTSDRLAVNDTAAAVPADQAETPKVMIEDGLKRTETRVVMTGSTPAGWVRAYQFVDATGALSAYTYFRQGGKTRRSDSSSVTEAELPGGELVLLDGVSVVRMMARASDAASLLPTIETSLPKIAGRHGIPPLLPTLMPGPGLDTTKLRYALGPTAYQAMGGMLPPEILGWDKSAEVATAEYSGRGGKGTLTLYLYPTPQIAGIIGRGIEQAVNQRLAKDGPADLGTVKLRRLGPLVAMTSGAWTPAQAQALVESVRLNQEVIFDQKKPPEFHAEIRKTATLLQEIAVFTGVLILAALVLGVFFGGARAGIRVLQGKPAASEPEFLTIDLRGKTKPFSDEGGPTA